LPVIGGVDDDRVLEGAGLLEPAEQLADAVVDEVDGGVVGLAAGGHLLGGERGASRTLVAATRVRIENLRSGIPRLGVGDSPPVAAQVAARCRQRRMRSAVAGDREP